MASDGKVTFEITADSSQAVSEIQKVASVLRQSGHAAEQQVTEGAKTAGEQVARSAKSAGQQVTASVKAAEQQVAGGTKALASEVENVINGMAAKLAQAFSAAKIGQAVLQFGKDAVSAASALEEVQNVVDVTFGDSANLINDWAKNAGKQFGLTETQAKQFSSTLGAMMKSSGVSDREIVKMSTDLAGLAADMASFYNLDFDTAFQKIRSGISGETEPLKQLGINMSVANLEAYALANGIDKAFSKMSQGEQTVLRYNYLMQATADAQGDFARTSDGYANSLRQMETNIEQLKTNVGTMILPVVAEAIGAVNDLFGALNQTPPETALDKFADIDLKAGEKIAEIERTATKAEGLIETYQTLRGINVSEGMTDFVDTLAKHFGDLDEALKKAEQDDYAGTLSQLANDLSVDLGGTPDQWNTLLTAIGESLPAAAEAAGAEGAGGVASFMEAAGQAAASLGGDYSALWSSLLTTLGDDAGAAISALAEGATAAANMEAISDAAGSLTGDGSNWGSLFDNLKKDTGALATDGDKLKTVAEGANALDAGAGEAWSGLKESVTGFPEDVTDLSDAAEGANALDADASGNWSNLKDAVDGFPGKVTDLSEVASGANDLDASAGANWKSLADAVNGLPRGGVDDKTATYISEVRREAEKFDLTQAGGWEALSSAIGKLPTNGVDKGVVEYISAVKDAAQTLKPGDVKSFTDLADSLGGTLAGLSGEKAQGAKDYVQALYQAFSEGAPESMQEFNAFIDNLQNNFPELFSSEEGQAMLEKYRQAAQQLGEPLSEAGEGMQGIAENGDEAKRVLTELANLPGLNLADKIDLDAGEVEGGTQALKDYVAVWEEYEKLRVARERHAEKGTALDESAAELEKLKADLLIAQGELKNFESRLAENPDRYELIKKAYETDSGMPPWWEEYKDFKDYVNYRAKIAGLQEQVRRGSADYETASSDYERESAAIDSLTESANAAAEAVGGLTQAQIEAGSAVADETIPALEDLVKYYEKVRESVESSVKSTVSGFKLGAMATPADELQKKIEDVDKTKDGWKEVVSGYESEIPTAENMSAALQEQLDYIDRYQTALQKVQEMGYNKDLIANFADGSTESLDYLEALAQGGDKLKDTINDRYDEVQQKRQEFVDSLTSTTLDGDAGFQTLVDGVNTQLQALDSALGGSTAAASAAELVAGIAEAVAGQAPELEAQIAHIADLLAQLSSLNLSWGGYSSPFVGEYGPVIPGYATGLDYVPTDNFLAYLHEGESVLTAEEAKVWRNFKYGGTSSANNIDYGALSGAIWDNAPKMGGGNVYLDGQTVGRVLSAQQANSLKTLQRSGWQG